MKEWFYALVALVAVFAVAVGVSTVGVDGSLRLCVDWYEGFTAHADGLMSAALPLVGIRELRKKRADLIGEAREILNAVQDGKLTAEQQERWDRAMADADALKEQIDREERTHDAEATLEERTRVRTAAAMGGQQEEQTEERAKKYSAAFRSYLRRGMGRLSADEQNALMEGYQEIEARGQTIGTDSEGGYTVPDEAMRPIEDALKAFGGMREVATILQTSTGANLPIPTSNDTSNEGAIIAEEAAVTEQDIAFGQTTLAAYMYTSKLIKVSLQFLQDSSINVEQFLGQKLGERLARITNRHFTVGTGSGQPQGIVTGAALGKTGATGQTTSVTYEDLIDLEHSVDPAYRNGARFMFHDSTLKALKKLEDSQGRPIWLPGVALREPDMILGYNYVINQHMAEMAASAKSILFGQLSKYLIREVRGVQIVRLNELYMGNLQVGFMGFARYDGKLLDAGTNPVKYYANPAS